MSHQTKSESMSQSCLLVRMTYQVTNAIREANFAFFIISGVVRKNVGSSIIPNNASMALILIAFCLMVSHMRCLYEKKKNKKTVSCLNRCSNGDTKKLNTLLPISNYNSSNQVGLYKKRKCSTNSNHRKLVSAPRPM